MSEPIQSSNFPAAILTVSREELDETRMMIVDGELPDDLQGHVFILAVAGFVDSKPITGTPIIFPSSDGTPVINGDGMICRLDFHKRGEESQPGEVWLKTKIAGTPSYWADKATTNSNHNYAEYKFRNYGVARISEFLGARNVLNTAWLPINFPGEDYRLLVTIDAGRPYEIDTESLAVVTPVGWNKEWIQQLKLKLPFELIMSTAHPYCDPRTREIFTVNYTQSLQTMLPPSLQYDFEELEHLPQIIEKFLQVVAKFLKEVAILLKDIQTTEEKFPLLQKADGLLRREISSFIEIDKESCDKLLPGKLHELWQGLQQILREDIQERENPDKLLDDLDDLLQLLKLAIQFLEGVKEMNDTAYLIRWDGKGDFEKWKLVLSDRTPVKIKQTMHQIGVTKDYIVLMDTSLKIGLEQLVNTSNHRIDNLLREVLDYPQLPETSVYIVPRAQLQKQSSHSDEQEVEVRKVTIPMEVFHFLVDYDNPNDQITLHASHACAWDVAEWLRQEDTLGMENPDPPVGMVIGSMDVNRFGRYLIDAKSGKLCESAVVTNLDCAWATAIWAYSNMKVENNYWWPPGQFENIYWNSWGAWNDLLSKYIFNLYKDYKYREETAEEVRQITQQGKPANICRLDTKQMKVCDRYDFPPGYFGNSPQFVPRANGNGDSNDGYIVCTVLYDEGTYSDNTAFGKSEIWIFDAKDLKQGGKDPVWGTEKPLCRLSHPQFKFGFTTHTTWLPQITPRPKGIYCIPVSKDYEYMANLQSQKIQELLKHEVYPHFPECEEQPASQKCSS